MVAGQKASRVSSYSKHSVSEEKRNRSKAASPDQYANKHQHETGRDVLQQVHEDGNSLPQLFPVFEQHFFYRVNPVRTASGLGGGACPPPSAKAPEANDMSTVASGKNFFML